MNAREIHAFPCGKTINVMKCDLYEHIIPIIFTFVRLRSMISPKTESGLRDYHSHLYNSINYCKPQINTVAV